MSACLRCPVPSAVLAIVQAPGMRFPSVPLSGASLRRAVRILIHESFRPRDRRRPHRDLAGPCAADLQRRDGALVLLVYIGIALPAVWSAKPARRKAAAAVLRQFFNACTGAISGRRQ